MEKAMSHLQLVELSKQNFKRTLDSLQQNAHSLLLLSIQWKEIEGFFDSTKTALEERAKELQSMDESIKVRALEMEAKEKEVCSVRESFEAIEESIKVRALELEAKEKEVSSVRESFEAKDESIKVRTLELEAKEKEVSSVRESFEAMEESIKVRTLEVETKEKEVYSVRESFEAKEESIKVRTLELEAKEKEVSSVRESFEAMEESIKVRTLELEAKEKEVNSVRESFEAKVIDLEKKKEAFVSEAMEKIREEFTKVKELEEEAKELDLKVKVLQQQQRGVSAGREFKFEPLVSLLAKNNIGSSVTLPTHLSADDLVKRNEALARMFPYLDPAKLVLDAVEGCSKEYLEKDFGEGGDDRRDSVVDSCIPLLERLMEMKVCVTREVKQEATQLGIDWIGKAKTTPENDSLVLGCLLFLAAYGLGSVTTREVLLDLLERFLLYEQAPRLFRHLGLEDEVSGVVETLKKKNEYLATLRFICKFRLSKLCPRWRPGAVLHEFLNSSGRAIRVTKGTGNLKQALKAKREKRKADAVIALDCIRENKAESLFSANALKNLSLVANNDSAPRATKPDRKSCEKGKNTANAVEKSKPDSLIPYEHKNEAKRQRLTEPITPFQNSTENQLMVVSAPSGDKVEELVANPHQPDANATYPLSTEAEPNILSGTTNADTLRELLEKQLPEESDLSNAIKCTPDPAKLVLKTSMALSPKTLEGGYDFKLLVSSDRCFLLLDHLKKLSLQIEHPVKDDAKKLAVLWKDVISKSKTDELEVVCFLKFLGIFDIVSEFKAYDLLGLLDSSYWQTVSPDLCQFLGLDNAIPGFIENLIKTGHRLKAVDYIYSFGMVHRFHPVSDLINASLRITKVSAEKSYRDAENEPAPQVAAIERQIKSLRAAIKCITCHKLESEFQLGDLEGQIKLLLKRRRNLLDGPSAGSVSKPNSTIKQSQTAMPPPNSAEVGSVTCNTPLVPSTAAAASSSVNKPGSTSNNKRGQKRSFSENKQSSVHVTSTPRNISSGS